MYNTEAYTLLKNDNLAYYFLIMSVCKSEYTWL